MKQAVISSISCLIVVFLLGTSNAQDLKPSVGEKIPQFELRNVSFYNKRSVSESDFLGKWLVLDFWFTGCSNCIKSFPKLNSLQNEFKDDIRFLLVGKNDKRYNGDIEKVYDRLRTKLKLDLSVAFDSILTTKWGIYSMPHIIIVDPKGIVRAITDGRDLNSMELAKVIRGETFNLFSKERNFAAVGESISGGSDIIFGSSLSKWNGQVQFVEGDIKDAVDRVKSNVGSGRGEAIFNVSMVPLAWLYNWAYIGYNEWESPFDSLYGKIYPRPQLTMKDTSRFVCDFVKNVGTGTYNYVLFTSKAKISNQYLMGILQADLLAAFGYSVSIETKQMPVWKLVSKNNAARKLATKGGKATFDGGGSSGGVIGLKMTNQPIKRLIYSIAFYRSIDDPPFIDETGIDQNVDIELDALLTDKNDIRRALQRIGLDLVRGTKEMKVLVISD